MTTLILSERCSDILKRQHGLQHGHLRDHAYHHDLSPLLARLLPLQQLELEQALKNKFAQDVELLTRQLQPQQ